MAQERIEVVTNRPADPGGAVPRPESFMLVLLLLALSAPTTARAQWPPWLKEEETEVRYPDIALSPSWLLERVGSDGVVVADARQPEEYLRGHIPGALSLPPDSLGSLDQMGQALAARGLTGREIVVCYADASSLVRAARLFWLLEMSGHRQVRLLDGGVDAWRSAGLDLERVARVLPQVNWDPAPDSSRMATTEYVRSHFGRPHPGRPGFEIIDARGLEAWESGPSLRRAGSAPSGIRTGHIPHSLPFDFGRLVAEDNTFPDADRMRRTFDAIGPRDATTVDLDSEFIVYDDGDDVTPWKGTLGYLLLRIAAVGRVRYYPDGWRRWSTDPSLPVTSILTSDDLQDSLTGIGAAETILFDARHLGDYSAGHIPGSVLLSPLEFADSLSLFVGRHWPTVDPASAYLVVYCYGEECVRSRNCTTLAAQRGFRHLGWFRGGLSEWKAAGGQVEVSDTDWRDWNPWTRKK